MRALPNTTGPVSYGETSWETGDTPEAFTGKSRAQELIFQANTVPLTSIFKHYNIRLDAVRYNITCPFKSHKGGRETTASFKYFSETNSFYCWGCRLGNSFSHGVEFVAAMDNISKEAAAQKIVTLFGEEINLEGSDELFSFEDFEERFGTMMEFSALVRDFRSSFIDEQSVIYIDKVCKIYDELNFERKLTNEALRRVVDSLKEKVGLYTPCPTL